MVSTVPARKGNAVAHASTVAGPRNSRLLEYLGAGGTGDGLTEEIAFAQNCARTKRDSPSQTREQFRSAASDFSAAISARPPPTPSRRVLSVITSHSSPAKNYPHSPGQSYAGGWLSRVGVGNIHFLP